MSTSRNRVITAVAAWALGVACFAAALDALYAPVIPVALGPMPTKPATPARGPEPTPVIEISPMRIVGERPRSRVPSVATTATRAPECGPWQALVQGDVSQRVRACDSP